MSTRPLPWLDPESPFPPVEQTWGPQDLIPGLLAAGGALGVDNLLRAYRQGIFPWFSGDQPILWWCPDPRMVLPTHAFRLSESLRKFIRSGLRSGHLNVRVDTAFEQVIHHCATTRREGQHGTWIVHDMRHAYNALHRAGHAHSLETWLDGELVGGLYCVNIGRMVFGESMFSHRSNASKIALAALVACCKQWNIPLIDCQQNTQHLASLGAHDMPRPAFLREVASLVDLPAPDWSQAPRDWSCLWHRTPVTPSAQPAPTHQP